MRIDGVYLRGVGPFSEARLDFQPRKAENKADVHIFVGPNGCGKSTLLYALAAALAGVDDGLGKGQLFRRMPSANSLCAVSMGGGVIAFARGSHNSEHNPIPDPFSGHTLFRQGSFGNGEDSWLANAPAPNLITQYPARALQHVKTGNGATPLSFAAFAYSGSRTLREYNFSSIEEPTDGPLAHSLSFDNTVDAKRLAQWLSATFAKRALARERENADDVERFASSIERIEEAVGEVIGAPIHLAIDYKPHFRIVVEHGGRSVDLDLLPDGLKSILSWMADLLMRLDRIPWEPETASLERPFVLFLDEIDVHLHPSWQRKVLPMVQRLFPKAQIFVTTHSPFVVSSVSDAWVYPLDIHENGDAFALAPLPSQAGTSFRAVLKSLFGVAEEFDQETEAGFSSFYALLERVLGGEDGQEEALHSLGIQLASRGIEVRDIVASELLRVKRRLGQRS